VDLEFRGRAPLLALLLGCCCFQGTIKLIVRARTLHVYQDAGWWLGLLWCAFETELLCRVLRSVLGGMCLHAVQRAKFTGLPSSERLSRLRVVCMKAAAGMPGAQSILCNQHAVMVITNGLALCCPLQQRRIRCGIHQGQISCQRLSWPSERLAPFLSQINSAVQLEVAALLQLNCCYDSTFRSS
jgi:hypothetical protein